MVAAALGNSEDTRVVNIPLKKDTEAAYGVYDGKALVRIVAVNMKAFNESTPGDRPSSEYNFQLHGNHHRVKVERLFAPGSDSVNNVTFGGVSYDYNHKQGKPVTVSASKEILEVQEGKVSIDIPDSSAVLLSLV